MLAVGCIYATCISGGLGYKNTIPWHQPDDLKHFWETIGNMPVVVDRKTWDATAKLFLRKRPGAKHYVLTKDKRGRKGNVFFMNSVDEIIEDAKKTESALWVCGGKEIYMAFEPHIVVWVQTKIFEYYLCDTFLPWDDHRPEMSIRVWRHWFEHTVGIPDACVDYFIRGKIFLNCDAELTALGLEDLIKRKKKWH